MMVSLGTYRDRNTAIKAIEEGVPASVYTTLKESIKVSDRDLAKVIQIPSRTLLRRKKEGRFNSDESDRIVMIAKLFSLATEVLGSEKRAGEWMQDINAALGWKTPLEFAKTIPGAQEVEELLYRIEYSMLS